MYIIYTHIRVNHIYIVPLFWIKCFLVFFVYSNLLIFTNIRKHLRDDVRRPVINRSVLQCAILFNSILVEHNLTINPQRYSFIEGVSSLK